MNQYTGIYKHTQKPGCCSSTLVHSQQNVFSSLYKLIFRRYSLVPMSQPRSVLRLAKHVDTNVPESHLRIKCSKLEATQLTTGMAPVIAWLSPTARQKPFLRHRMTLPSKPPAASSAVARGRKNLQCKDTAQYSRWQERFCRLSSGGALLNPVQGESTVTVAHPLRHGTMNAS